MRWVGKLSYSLYLWHWPLLIVAAAQLGPLSMTEGTAVAAAAFVPAYLSFRFIEDPIRKSERLIDARHKPLQLGFACTAVGVLAGLGLVFAAWPPAPPFHPLIIHALPLPNGHQADQKLIGAMILSSRPLNDMAGAPIDHVRSIVPEPAQALKDNPNANCIANGTSTQIHTCIYGDLNSSVDVALVGDSHAAQWLGALDAIGKQRGWKVTTYLKANCPFGDTEFAFEGRAYTSCSSWTAQVRAALSGPSPPALVIASGVDILVMRDGVVLSGADSLSSQAAGYERAWTSLIANGTHVVAINDTPRPGFLIPECVSQHLDELSACTFPRARTDTARSAIDVAAQHISSVIYVDLNSAICPTRMCAPVIGGVLVYRDSNHLTGTYAGTLAPRLNLALPIVGS